MRESSSRLQFDFHSLKTALPAPLALQSIFVTFLRFSAVFSMKLPLSAECVNFMRDILPNSTINRRFLFDYFNFICSQLEIFV